MELDEYSTDTLHAELNKRKKKEEVREKEVFALETLVYHRGMDKNLHATKVECDTPGEAIIAVIDQLNKEKERFTGPLLALINCGKPTEVQENQPKSVA